MAINTNKQVCEIPARKVETARATEKDFNYIKEVVVDYHTAQLLLEKDKPVYTKTITTANGIKSLFVVKVSSKHYLEFLENSVL